MHDKSVIGREEAIILIDEQIAAHAGGILAALAPFEAESAIKTWHGDTLVAFGDRRDQADHFDVIALA